LKKFKLYEALHKAYGDKPAWQEVDEVLKAEAPSMASSKEPITPFENLIIGILSQTTSDRNSTRAYIGLARKFKIEPQALAEADEAEIREAIRPGGLHNVKAKRIKAFATSVMEKYGGDLTSVLMLPYEEARKKLDELPSIGVKTADVCLAYCARQAVLPVDTNIERVTKRLGLASNDATYGEIQKALEEVIPPAHRVRGHELLVRLGRDYCKPRKPSCESCPLLNMCAYGSEMKS